VLVCNWLHFVGQNHFYVMMLIIQECCFIQSLHFSLNLKGSVPLQPSGLCDIPFGCSTVQASSVLTTRTFHLDLPLYRETSNCSSLHPSGRRPVFDQLWDFFPKHRYGKTVVTVRTKCIPVRMHSFIRQVMYSKSRRPDISLHGSDA
jgi:hypothetical protein